MSANRGFIVWVSGAVMMALPVLAAGQTPANDLPVFVGQKVWITSADGRVTKGKVLNLTPAGVEIGGGKVVATNFAVEDVRRIQVSDSVRDGVVRGAISLGLAGLLVGAWGDAAEGIGEAFATGLAELFGAEVEPVPSSHNYLIGAVVGAATGAILGYAVDDAKVKTVYERKDDGMSVSLRPIVSVAGKGVGVRVRW